MAFRKAELLFEVIQEQDGGFVADCLNEDIIKEIRGISFGRT
jgi:hypothetical protein